MPRARKQLELPTAMLPSLRDGLRSRESRRSGMKRVLRARPLQSHRTLTKQLKSKRIRRASPLEMRDFARLYSELDSTTRTSEKIAAMRRYFENAAPGDAAWAVSFLRGRKPKL